MDNSILKKNFNPGAFPDRPDARDLKYSDIVFGAPQIDWEKGYDVERELKITLRREHQNGSSSCVAQAYTKLMEVLNFIETKKLVDFSPKSIYEQIFLPQGGATLRDGAKAAVDGGVALEADVPSYENGVPPSEAYMRKQTLTADIRKSMRVFKCKEYRTLGFATAEYVAHAIANNYGCVTGAIGSNVGWSTTVVRPPKPGEQTWGHAIYLLAYGIDKIGKWFEFLNSWGKSWGANGRGRVYFNQYDMANNFFGGWALTDQPNITPMANSNVKIIKDQNSPSVGIWLPALSEEALKSYCLNFGIEVPYKEDGGIDWEKLIQGNLILK